jgi:UPF0755 protein
MIARLLVVLFALIVVGVGVGVGYFVLGDTSSILGTPIGQLADPMAPVDPRDSTSVIVTVPPGATANDIVGTSLAAGDYELSKSMSTSEIIQVLARGQVKRGLVATIPEGWRSEQIADRLQETGFASRDEFLGAVAAPPSVPGLEVLTPTPPARLEGYLFPETYEVPQKVPGSRAAELMVRMFSQRVGDALRSGSEPPSKLNPQQVITLASVVEREAKVPSERATIASVYLNRLAADMPLQADPTVQYAVATRDGPAAAAYNYWRKLTPDDLQIPSPYNSYINTGLPPGPICNPGEASIRAVLQPARTDYLYFVANPDGSGTHLFARTLEEHNANVAKVTSR